MSIKNTIKAADELPAGLKWAADNAAKGLRSGPVVLMLCREGESDKRTTAQNAKLWPMLADISEQCLLTINGVEAKASGEDWKNVFTASLTSELRVASGIDGGVVFLGESTSRMSKEKFSNLIEVIYAYGANHNVRWSEKAVAAYESYREAQQ